MFDFERLDVYQKTNELNQQILRLLKSRRGIDSYLRDQLRRASISAVINIAEGSGKFSRADKRNFYTIARGSVYESVSLLELLRDGEEISRAEFDAFYKKLEVISKMLLGLINSQNP